MKEIIQALESRIKSPVIGYFTLAILLINWQEIFYLFADKGTAKQRIDFFVTNTSRDTLLWYPLAYAVSYTIIYPWINLIFLYLCRKPNDLKNNLQATSEHKLLIEKNKLENVRSEFLATAETSIIEQAKRDLEISKIEDQELKRSVQANVESLRKDESSKMIPERSKYVLEDPQELFKTAKEYREKAGSAHSASDRERWSKRALELEEKAHTILSGSKVNT